MSNKITEKLVPLGNLTVEMTTVYSNESRAETNLFKRVSREFVSDIIRDMLSQEWVKAMIVKFTDEPERRWTLYQGIPISDV